MKYSSVNKPLVCMQTQSTCYKNTSIMTVRGVLWHSTGANNPNLKRYVQPSYNAKDKEQMLKILGKNTNKNDWNHIDTDSGVNAWIGLLANDTVTSIQTMPWNYRPWGCGSGSKGSCNNGWIQFEICESSLSDKNYFNKIYKEACELTAYLCDLYNLDPKGTVAINGIKVPVILCHADSYDLKMGSNHGDVLHWFKKHGKTMDDVRNDVATLMNKNNKNENTIEIIKPKIQYYVRKDWDNKNSQIGAYADLNSAKQACDKAGKGYEVYNLDGIAVYPIINQPKEEKEETIKYKIGEAVKLVSGAKYISGIAIPNWLLKTTVYVREIRKNGDIVFSTQKSGAITGVANQKYFINKNGTSVADKSFKSYIVCINTDVLNVRSGPSTSYKITTKVKKHELYTIIDEKNGWGKLKSGAGWISLTYVKKVR